MKRYHITGQVGKDTEINTNVEAYNVQQAFIKLFAELDAMGELSEQDNVNIRAEEISLEDKEDISKSFEFFEKNAKVRKPWRFYLERINDQISIFLLS